MKKAIWIVAFIPLLITTIVLKFMPDKVPMHYNAAGEIDRWGSKYEQLIFPITIIILAFIMYLFIHFYEKKAMKAENEKDKVGALSNAKVLKIVSIVTSIMFGILNAVFLYSAYMEAGSNAETSYFDFNKVTGILMGIVFIVLGNFMPKTRKNGTVGVRTIWSSYNDVTWAKSNRAGGIYMIIAGIFTIITSIILKSIWIVVLEVLYVIIASIASVVYSYKIYKKEIAKEKQMN